MEQVRKATTNVGATNEFILSDETRDRFGDVVEAAGWDLRQFRKNPIALFGHNHAFPIGVWKNVRIEGKKLLGKLELAAAGTSARIDELRSLVEQGILRAVSVGFLPLEEPKRVEGGLRFTKQELIECSLVGVPANPAALAVAKGLGISDETLQAVFGVHAVARALAAKSGGHAETSSMRKPIMKPNLAARIADAQKSLNDARDLLTAHVNGEEVDETVVEELSAAIEEREARLGSLRRAERALAFSTLPGSSDDVLEGATVDILPPNRSGTSETAARGGLPSFARPAAPPTIRRPLGVMAREPRPADLVVRAAVCHLVGYVLGKDPLQVLDERYGDHERTQVFTRAAISGALTTTAGWAAELVEEATTDFLSTLRPISVFPRLAEAGQSLTFGPGRGAIKIPSRASTPSITGSFVAEGAPIPVRRIGLTSITLLPHKLGVISVFSREMARYSNPQIEGLLRTEIQWDTALTIDTLLFDATAGSAIRPAGLRNGVSSIVVSTAGGYAAILADLNALLAPFDAANASSRIALVMNPREARQIAMTPGPDGTFGWANGFLGEFLVIASTTIPTGDVFAIAVDDFVAVNGQPEFDVSEQTTLHMEDTAPLHIGTAGTPNVVAAPVQSMFQTAQIALRMLMDCTWAMRRTGMVTWADNVDWAP